MPILDQQVRDCLSIASGSDTEKLFLTAPVRWIDAGEDGEMTAVSVGSIEGKQRKEAVATLHALAVRVATSSSRHTQGQGIDTIGAPASRPSTHHNHEQQAALPSRPLSKGQPSSIPTAPATNLSTSSLPRQPLSTDGAPEHPVQNGGPPEKISLPPPPHDIERTKTEYMTPPSDPSEIPKNLG